MAKPNVLQGFVIRTRPDDGAHRIAKEPVTVRKGRLEPSDRRGLWLAAFVTERAATEFMLRWHEERASRALAELQAEQGAVSRWRQALGALVAVVLLVALPSGCSLYDQQVDAAPAESFATGAHILCLADSVEPADAAAVLAALGHWETASDGRLTLSPRLGDCAGDDAVTVRIEPAPEGLAGAYTGRRHIVIDPSVRELQDGVLRVALHELGHAFGLGHAEPEANVMHPALARTTPCIDPLTAELIAGRPTCGEEP